MRRKTTAWLVRLLTRWGVIQHPYGEGYAKRTIGPLGEAKGPARARTSGRGGSQTDDPTDA